MLREEFLPLDESRETREARELKSAVEVKRAELGVGEEFDIREEERKPLFKVDPKTARIFQVSQGEDGVPAGVAQSNATTINKTLLQPTAEMRNFKFRVKTLVAQGSTPAEATKKVLDQQFPEDIRYFLDQSSGILMGVKDGVPFKIAELPRVVARGKITTNQLESAGEWLEEKFGKKQWKSFDERTKASLRAFFLRSLELGQAPAPIEGDVPDTFWGISWLGALMGKTKKAVIGLEGPGGEVAVPGVTEIPNLSPQRSPLRLGGQAEEEDLEEIIVDAQGNIIQ